MLYVTGHKVFEVTCPLRIEFNVYYKKTGWELTKVNEEFNYWKLSIEV